MIVANIVRSRGLSLCVVCARVTSLCVVSFLWFLVWGFFWFLWVCCLVCWFVGVVLVWGVVVLFFLFVVLAGGLFLVVFVGVDGFVCWFFFCVRFFFGCFWVCLFVGCVLVVGGGCVLVGLFVCFFLLLWVGFFGWLFCGFYVVSLFVLFGLVGLFLGFCVFFVLGV